MARQSRSAWGTKKGNFSVSSRTLSVEYLPTAALRLDPRNPRIHTDKQLRQIADSIQSFGFNVPVLVDAGLQVIAGHGRVLASKLLGETRLPVIRLEHLSEHQIRAFMIAQAFGDNPGYR